LCSSAPARHRPGGIGIVVDNSDDVLVADLGLLPSTSTNDRGTTGTNRATTGTAGTPGTASSNPAAAKYFRHQRNGACCERSRGGSEAPAFPNYANRRSRQLLLDGPSRIVDNAPRSAQGTASPARPHRADRARRPRPATPSKPQYARRPLAPCSSGKATYGTQGTALLTRSREPQATTGATAESSESNEAD